MVIFMVREEGQVCGVFVGHVAERLLLLVAYFSLVRVFSVVGNFYIFLSHVVVFVPVVSG